MTAPKERLPTLGQQLFALGWRQGSLFTAPSATFCANDSSPRSPTTFSLAQEQLDTDCTLVVASQNCDIVAGDDAEPYIEALRCTRMTDKSVGELAFLDRTSSRWLVIDPDEKLVAHANAHVLFHKRALLGVTRSDWPSTRQRFRRFQDKLAGRYNRPDLPDSLVVHFQEPLKKRLESLLKRQPRVLELFNDVITQILIYYEQEEPPFGLHVVLLSEVPGLTAEAADAIARVRDELAGNLDPAVVGVDLGWDLMTTEEMSIAQYSRLTPVALDYFTYQGDLIVGAEPPLPAT